MEKRILTLVFLQIFFALSLTADSGRHSVYISFGLDYGLATLTLGYSHRSSLDPIGWEADLFINLTVPMAKADLGDFRFRAGGDMDILDSGDFSIPFHGAIVFRGFENSLVKGYGFGSELGLPTGFYADSLSLAGEFIWDRQWITRLKHSAYFQTWFYRDVRDGWYYLSGDTCRFGVYGSCPVSESLTLDWNGGYESQGPYSTKAPPLYMLVSSHYMY